MTMISSINHGKSKDVLRYAIDFPQAWSIEPLNIFQTVQTCAWLAVHCAEEEEEEEEDFIQHKKQVTTNTPQ